MKILKSFIKTFMVAACLTVVSFAEESVSSDSAKTAELLEEIAIRDSVMALHDSSCAAEKDSLRFAMKMESSMSDSWKQSYEMMKSNNEACNKALNNSLNENEKSKDEAEENRQSTLKSNIGSFAAGLGLGILLFLLF